MADPWGVFDSQKEPVAIKSQTDPWGVFGAEEISSTPVPEPSTLSSNPVVNLGRGLVKGAAYGVPQQLAKAYQFGAKELGVERGVETAKAVSDWAEKGLGGKDRPEPGMFEQAGQMISESSIPSVGLMAAGAGISMLPIPGARLVGGATMLAGKYVTPALFGLSQAQQTRETAAERGVEEGATPYVTGGIEWAGETLGTMAFGRVLGPLGKVGQEAFAKLGAKGAMKGSIMGLAKQLAFDTMPTEIGTEMGQNYFEALAEKRAGIRPEADPWKEAVSAIGPTAIMTLVTGGAAHGARQFLAARQSEILATPIDKGVGNASDLLIRRMRAADGIEDLIARDNPELKEQWRKYAAQKIQNNEPIDITSPLDTLSLQIDQQMGALKGESAAISVPAAAIKEETPSQTGQQPAQEPLVSKAPSTALPGATESISEAEPVAKEVADRRQGIAEIPATLERRGEQDRRTNVEQRRRISEMSSEEVRRELGTDSLTGLGSKRLYDDKETERKSFQASIDADSLKWINDNVGHETGSAYLARIGEAFRNAGLKDPTDAYRTGGDEFVVEANTQEEIKQTTDNAKAYLQANPLVFEYQGKTYNYIPQISVGVGGTFAEADKNMLAEKEARTKAGQRAERGEMPPQIKAGTVVVASLTPAAEKVEAAANEAATSPVNQIAAPTEAQKDAGNYRLGHVNIQGLDISIENPAGSVRKGVDKAGKAWETPMANHYGYIKGTKSNKDGKLDVFIGPKPESQQAFVVVQQDPKTKQFDEHKSMLGFDTAEDAMNGYLDNYDATGPERIKNIIPMSMDQFKQWTKMDVTKELKSAPKLEGKGTVAVREKVQELKVTKEVQRSISKFQKLAKTLGDVDLGEIKYLNEDRQVDYNTPEGKRLVDAWGLPKERLDAIKAGTETVYIDGQHVVYEVPDAISGNGYRSYITLFRGHTAGTVYHEGGHALHRQGYLRDRFPTDSMTDSENAARYVEQMLSDGKDQELMEVLRPAPTKQPAGAVETARPPPASRKVKGSESLPMFRLETKAGTINNPAMVLTKLKNDNPLESQKQIEKIAKKAGQWRDVTKEGWTNIMNALRRAPTVGELAATGWAGRAARWWYQDDEVFFKKVLGKDAYKFFGVMAATSPQSKAETENIRYGVNAWTDYVNLRKELGREPNREEITELVAKMDIGMENRRGGVIRALSGDQLGATEGTLKTRFYHNALYGIELGAVLDIWHGRGMGQLKFTKEGSKIALGQDFADSIIYSVLADRMDKAAKTLDLPQSASQASQWCMIKAIWDRMGSSKDKRKYGGIEALKSITNKDVALAGNYTTGIANYFKEGHPIIDKIVAMGIPREEIANLKTAVELLEGRGIDPKAFVYRDAPPAIQKELERLATRLEKTRDLIDTLKAQEVHTKREEPPLHMSVETTHGPFAGLPWVKRLAMHKEIRKGPLNDKVIKMLGVTFGLKVVRVVDGPGLWYNTDAKKVEVNPNFTIHMAIPPGKMKKELADRLKGFGASLAYINRQASVGFTHPVVMEELFEAAGGPVMSINLGRVITKEQGAAVAKAIAENMPENSAFVVPTDTGMVITMPRFDESYPMDYDTFVDHVLKVLDKARINNVKGIKFFEKDILEGGDLYEGRRTGKEIPGDVSQYTDAIGNGGGSRSISRADKLLVRTDAIKDKYATDKIRKELAELEESRGLPDGQSPGLAEGAVQEKVDFSLKTRLSKPEMKRVTEALAKDRASGSPVAFRNKEVILTHWSKIPNLKQTDPTKHGTGAAGAELKAKDAHPDLWLPKTYTGFGTYTAEAGLGRYRYQISVPGNNIYDAWEDPLNLWPSAEETRKLGYYTKAAQGLIHEQRMKDVGYDGYASTPFQVVALFNPVAVNKAEASEKVIDQPDYSLRTFQADTPEFKKWFGNSKVVDENGKPLVVYHGTSGQFTEFKEGNKNGWSVSRPGFYFTDDRSAAQEFSGRGVEPMATYLSMKKPADLRYNGKEGKVTLGKIIDSMPPEMKTEYEGQSIGRLSFDGMFQTREFLDSVKAAGFDGIIIEDALGKGKYFDSYIAFSPTQIKSATGNTGAFDPDNQDIRYSLRTWATSTISAVTGRPATAAPSSTNQRGSWDSPEPSMLNDLNYTLLDKMIDLRDVTKAIKNFSGTIADTINASLRETLYSGRVGKRTQDFLDKEMVPALETLANEKLELEGFEIYLHNRHAKEANDYVRSSGGLQDGGSGIKDADADAYMNGLDPALQQKYERIAKMVDAITHKNAQLLVAYGLETQETIDKWLDKYKHYVPLFREEIEGNMGTGAGFSIIGSASKGRKGSTRKVVDIIANIANQRERTITRGEKNIISTALYGLAKANPNEDFWKIARPSIKTTTDVDTGEVVRVPDLSYKQRDSVVMHRTIEGGKIVEKGVEFNTRDERARRMAESLKNMDMDTLGAILGTTAKVTRFIAAMNTQYNPVFGVTNFIRDLGTALFNLSTTPIAGKQAEIFKNSIPAMKGIFDAVRAKKGGTPVTSSWGKLFEEFQLRGGQTGYRDIFKTTEERTNAMEREIRVLQSGKILKAGYAIKNLVADYNTATENAIRLAAYKAGVDSGMSKDQAAAMAKGLTVNFNKKGQIATQAGAMYAFFNASIQGVARMAETLAGPVGKRIIIGGMTFGVVQAAMLAAAGFGDDEPPEWVQERNIIIPLGGKKYATIPMPLGFNVFPNIGRVAAQMTMSGFEDSGKKLSGLMGMIFEAANPMGSSGLSLQTLTPTVLDPLAALAENKDWTGKKIYREDFSSLDPTPGFARSRERADSVSRGIAWGLNMISGGTKHTPGLLSPTADQIQYLAGQITGGVGREIIKSYQTAESLATGEETPPHRIPLVSRFYGDMEGKSNQANKFYDNIKMLNIHEAEIKDRKTNREEYLKDHPEAKMWHVANRVENAISDLNKRRRLMIEREVPKDMIKNMDNLIATRMRTFNEAVAQARR